MQGQHFSLLVKPVHTVAEQDTKTPRKIRKAHSKVRTGCLTCKIRRKKCDEAKPACLRCTSTGRKCDGYAPEVANRALPVTRAATFSKFVDEGLCTKHRGNEYNKAVTNDEKQATASNGVRKRKVANTSTTSDDGVDSGYGTPTGIMHNSTREATGEFVSDCNTSETGLSSIRSPGSRSINCDVSSAPYVYIVPSESSKRYHQLPWISSKISQISIVPSEYHQLTDLEKHCFSFFRYQTCPTFLSYFSAGIWRNYIVKAALEHPVVLSCALALGAAHRRHEYGISREAFEYCTHVAKLHGKALTELGRLKQAIEERGETTPRDKEILMTSELLLSNFETFQDENERSVQHLCNGIRHLLDRHTRLIHSESRYYMVNARSEFSGLVDQLHCRARYFFDTPTRILTYRAEGKELPSIPDTFVSLEEARDFVFTELDWIRTAPVKTWQNVDEKDKAQRLHTRRISQWSVSYSDTVRAIGVTLRQKRACNLMKLVRSAAYLALHFLLSAKVDMGSFIPAGIEKSIYDVQAQDHCLAFASDALWQVIEEREDLVANLISLKVMVESVLDETHAFHLDEHSVSFDTAIGPPICSEIEPRSSAKARHMVKYSNTKQPTDDELWSILGTYSVAERLSGLEEHAVISAVKGLFLVKEDPTWVDMSFMMEERRLLLSYCRPDDHGFGLLWTQEWWEF